MEPELEALEVDASEEDSLAAIADLYVANLDVRDPAVLRKAYTHVIESVPEHLKRFYAEAAGIAEIVDEST